MPLHLAGRARQFLHRRGVELRRPGTRQLLIGWGGVELDRDTLSGSLSSASRNGLVPGTVIDVGAAGGTPGLYEPFPNARFLLIEPLDEFKDALLREAGLIGAVVFTGTAGAVEGNAIIHVHPDLSGSSTFLESEDSEVNGVPRTVRQATVDGLVRQHELPGPYLLKVDAQGAEADVLEGATSVLAEAALVVLEVSFHPFFAGAPEVAEIVQFLQKRGLVPYDIVDRQYRPLDGAMSQVDMVFVPVGSVLRQHAHYASRAQREAQDHKLRRKHGF